MNFSPFYYQVQEIIKNDDDSSLRNILSDETKRTEFNSYYEDFLHCTYPHSFKCLYLLMNDMTKRYNIHSVLSHCFKNNNEKWLILFFDTFQKKKEENKSDSLACSILNKNIFAMSIDLDYSSLLNSNEKIWEIMFSHCKLDLFKPHLLTNEIFDDEQYSKVYLLEKLCHKYNLELPIKNILQKCFEKNELDIAEYFLQKYSPNFDDDDTTDLLNFVSLTGNPDIFKFFTQHFLDFNDFNQDKIALAFNAGFIVNKVELSQYLKEKHHIDFYPVDEKLKKEFIEMRNTMWEDNDVNSPFSLSLLTNINHLFNIYQWSKEDLIKELKPFNELSQLFSKISLNEKLQSKLENKHTSHTRGKI